jgi:uncharacterized membrane protein
MTKLYQSTTRVLLLVISGLIVLGQFGRFEFPYGIAVYAFEICMAVVVLMGMWQARANVRAIFPSQRLMRYALLVAGTILLSALSVMDTPVQFAVSLLYAGRFLLYIGFFFTLFHVVKIGWVQQKEIPKLWIVPLLGVAGIGLLQYLFLPDTRGLALLGWDDHYYRLISTVFDPGFTGALLVSALLFLQYKTPTWKSIQTSLPSWIVMILTLGAVLLTYSRASFVAYGVGSLILLLRTRQLRHVFLLLLFIVCIPLLPRPRSEGARLERTASVIARVESVKEGIQVQSLPQFIIGNGWYGDKQIETHLRDGNVMYSHASAPDNSYVFLFSSLGIVGCIVFALFALELMRLTHWQVLPTAIFGALGVHALFSNTWFHPFVLWMVAMLLVSYIRYTKPMASS